MEETVHALDYLHILRRRKVWLVTPIVLSILVGIALLQMLPKEYEASTTIAVAAPVVSTSVINSSGPLDNQERLRALNQQLVSTAILSWVATEAGLTDPSGQGTPDEQLHRVVGALRQAISVRLPQEVIYANEPRRLDAFLIVYKDADPQRAKRVADTLATRFVSENSKTRTARAEGTATFIAEQLDATQQRLLEYEGKLRVAKEAHMGELPEQTQANLANLAGLRQQLESNANALRGEEDRLAMVERSIESLTRVPDSPDGRRRPLLDPESPEGELAKLEQDLAAARARWAPKHPEVQRLQDDVESARQRVASAPKSPGEVRAPAYVNDPFYRQMVADREARQQRIRDLHRNEKDLQSQIALYQRRVETAPRVEQQLAALVRDYGIEREYYASLKGKLQYATISESVERTGVSEQFTLLYPAGLPTIPTKPVPIRVMLLSVASGLAVGIGLTLLREYLDRSVKDVRALRNEFDVPVLGEVARIQPR